MPNRAKKCTKWHDTYVSSNTRARPGSGSVGVIYSFSGACSLIVFSSKVRDWLALKLSTIVIGPFWAFLIGQLVPLMTHFATLEAFNWVLMEEIKICTSQNSKSVESSLCAQKVLRGSRNVNLVLTIILICCLVRYYIHSQ